MIVNLIHIQFFHTVCVRSRNYIYVILFVFCLNQRIQHDITVVFRQFWSVDCAQAKKTQRSAKRSFLNSGTWSLLFSGRDTGTPLSVGYLFDYQSCRIPARVRRSYQKLYSNIEVKSYLISLLEITAAFLLPYTFFYKRLNFGPVEAQIFENRSNSLATLEAQFGNSKQFLSLKAEIFPNSALFPYIWTKNGRH